MLAALGVAGAGVLALPSCKRGYQPADEDEYARALNKPYVPGAGKYFTGEERWLSTSCAQCPAGCGLRVRVVEGRAVRIEGNPRNPLNEGGIGPRGLSSLQLLYDADRLTGPMMRNNGRLEPVEWDTAIDHIAAKLETLRIDKVPERLLVIA
jgi:anaerobic selenocysteine-containing dehydrogenase